MLIVANQPYRFRHPQFERPDDFQNAGKAGALVLGGFVALHLLRLDPQSAREAFLRHSRSDARADEGFRQILDCFQNHFLAPANVEPLIGINLLL